MCWDKNTCIVQYLSIITFRRDVLRVGYSPLSLYYILLVIDSEGSRPIYDCCYRIGIYRIIFCMLSWFDIYCVCVLVQEVMKCFAICINFVISLSCYVRMMRMIVVKMALRS